MTTAFKLLCDRCGLSQREAAVYLGSRLDTVKSWSAGRNNPPVGVMNDLRALYAVIDTAALDQADEIERQIKRNPVEEIEIGIAIDDHEAQGLGLPCVGAHGALIGLVVAQIDVPFRVVPRGSTIGTAGAADARERD